MRDESTISKRRIARELMRPSICRMSIGAKQYAMAMQLDADQKAQDEAQKAQDEIPKAKDVAYSTNHSSRVDEKGAPPRDRRVTWGNNQVKLVSYDIPYETEHSENTTVPETSTERIDKLVAICELKKRIATLYKERGFNSSSLNLRQI